MAFNIALSGLNAASADLEVTANNIANTGTTGFKGSRAQFAELFSAAGPNLSATQIGSGVRLTVRRQGREIEIPVTVGRRPVESSG